VKIQEFAKFFMISIHR